MTRQSPILSSAASISCTQRRAASTAANSVADTEFDDHRWSDLVPPDSGLTFAVVWDPEGKDTLTFTTAEFTDSASPSFDTSSNPGLLLDIYHDSQMPAIRASGAAQSNYALIPSPAIQFFRDNITNNFLGESTFFPDRPTRGWTQTSSTMDGLDVYLRGSMLGCAHNTNRYYSCFQDLDGDFVFDPRTSFAKLLMGDAKEKDVLRDDVSDEGFFEGDMSSRFSGTTTSTSNFIAVDSEIEDAASTEWATLQATTTSSYYRLLSNALQTAINRLHKTHRPNAILVSGPPSDVLHRAYSHIVPLHKFATANTVRPQEACSLRPMPSHPSRRPFFPRSRKLTLTLPKFARTFKETDGAGWVWIDVKGGSALEPAGSL
ncbi:hypothetical protein B0H13DRAFT_2340773 [Mycena leptocephala]|nr:hypothetical protein B0H13DRAFT_2340773 [Mycena leptocephala]